MSRCLHWAFTLNNYTDQEYDRIFDLNIHDVGIDYLLVGKEIGEEGTPHLQGHVSFKNRLRLNQVKNLIAIRGHFERCIDLEAHYVYCKKDGQWFERGTPISSAQGNRTDMDRFKDSVKSGILDMRALRELHSNIVARYPNFVRDYVEDHTPEIAVEHHDLRLWQSNLCTLLDGEPDRRHIVFVVDRDGNAGKSWFADWYASTHDNCQVLNPGRKADLSLVLRSNLRVVFLDCPRSKQGEFIQYDFLEDLKNGRVFCSKYMSTIKRYAPMHVVVMMNEDPDMDKLSPDRYVFVPVDN